MNRYFFPIKTLFLVLFISLSTISCNNDDDPISNSDTKINSWIYEVMKDVYYWTDFIPTPVNRDQPPADFFESLRYPKDHFSALFPNFQELINALNGIHKEAGYEFVLSRISLESNDVIGIVTYIKPNSPAHNAGLKRGDMIEKINGKFINMSNYGVLMDELSYNHALTVARSTEESDFEIQPDIALNVVALQENPNFLDTVYTIEGQKVAYFVYNFFAEGINDKRYNDQMDAIFADFKSKGVTDLILDLRYNSGGSVSAATNLASLIGDNVGPDKVFYENKWNASYQNYIENLEDGEEILRQKFKNKSENIGNLIGGRVYVLTGSRTASASELIINGLMPYMDVFMLGDTTVGKNVGSIAIEDEKNEANDYGMLPIVFKIYNSEGFSEYGDGFEPDIFVNELELPMRQLGDIEEKLLASALAIIKNKGNIVSRRQESLSTGLKPLVSSIDKKARTNRTILNINTP